MRPKTTNTLSSTGAAAMAEATNNPSEDHASEIETDNAVNVTVKLGLLGEVIPPETIPDFLEPMPEEELGTWEDTDAPELGPA
jgi:hypothetical protein